jgi:NADH-quinone oxidoreductase subunit L
VGTAAVTGYYMLRLFYVVFLGPPAGERPDIHEPAPSMLVPVGMLAALTTTAGLLQPGPWHVLTDYLSAVFGPEGGVNPGLLVLTILVALTGMGAAYARFGTGIGLRGIRGHEMDGVLGRALLWDDLYAVVVVRPLWSLAGMLDRALEGPIVVGGADATARAAAALGQQVRRVQSGYLRSYAALFALGSIVLLLAAVGISLR